MSNAAAATTNDNAVARSAAEFANAVLRYVVQVQRSYNLRGGGYVVGIVTCRRYVRVVKTIGSSRSVVAFVDGRTGNLHAARSWNGAGRVVGNVYDNGVRALTDAGAAALAGRTT